MATRRPPWCGPPSPCAPCAVAALTCPSSAASGRNKSPAYAESNKNQAPSATNQAGRLRRRRCGFMALRTASQWLRSVIYVNRSRSLPCSLECQKLGGRGRKSLLTIATLQPRHSPVSASIIAAQAECRERVLACQRQCGTVPSSPASELPARVVQGRFTGRAGAGFEPPARRRRPAPSCRGPFPEGLKPCAKDGPAPASSSPVTPTRP